MKYAVSGPLEPIVGVARAFAHLLPNLVGKAEALLRDCGSHRGTLGDGVDQPPEGLAGPKPLEEPVDQAAVEEAVDQLSGAVASEGSSQRLLQVCAVDRDDHDPLE